MLRRLSLAALTVSIFAPLSSAQIYRYTFQGTITSANPSGLGEIWDGVQVGDPYSVSYRVDTSIAGTIVSGEQTDYLGPIFEADVDINGVQAALTGFPTVNQVTVFDNRTVGTFCSDGYDYRIDANASDVLQLDIFLRKATPLPTCPTSVSGFALPTSLTIADFTSMQTRLFMRTRLGGSIGGSLNSAVATLETTGNDDCANAIALPSFFTTTPYDATGATTDGLASVGFCDYGPFGDEQNHNDIWFTYTPAVGGCTYITTRNLAGYDTRLTIYDGNTCPDDPASILACVDDEDQPTQSPFEAGLDVQLSAGTTYTIRIGTFNASTQGGPGAIMIAAGPGADVNSAGINPGAPGCTDFPNSCNGNGGNQLGCTDCPCSNNAPTGSIGGCTNSALRSARLLATGDPSVSLPSGSTTDLRFGLAGAPNAAFCILNSGDAVAPTSMANPCFGLNSGVQALIFDGLRCAVQNTRRHGGRSADGNGTIGLTNNPWGGEGGPAAGIAVAGGGFSASQTRYFQVIYRDNPLASCMRGLNTSQTIEVTFTP